MKLNGTCEETGCTETGRVGLQGVWLCLDHFDARLIAMKAAQEPARPPKGETC